MYDYIRQIGALHAQGGDFEKALEYYGHYAELLPADYRSFTAIASAHSGLGEHEQARAAYERAQVIDWPCPWMIAIRSVGGGQAVVHAVKQGHLDQLPSLGFGGRYRLTDSGRALLEEAEDG